MDFMVVRKRYIGSMLRIERNLEIVAKVAVGAATKASAGNSTSMNYVVAGRILRERGTRFRALNRFCRLDVPVRQPCMQVVLPSQGAITVASFELPERSEPN